MSIHPTAIIIGKCRIHPSAEIGPYCVIGGDPEHLRKKANLEKPVVIEAGAILREFVTVHRGIEGGRGTRIGKLCYLQRGAHIAHDCRLSKRVNLANNVTLGGSVTIHEGAVLGMGSSVHQFVTIGAWAMLGMGAALVHDLPPGCTAAGCPARHISQNARGLERHSITADQLADAALIWNQARQGSRPHIQPR